MPKSKKTQSHVYLIEDDADLRQELVYSLEGAGLTVMQFDTAESFLKTGVTHSPSVIVADMVLPGLSGLKLFESIRGQGIQTPLVFISGYSEPNQIIDGMKLGAVDFLWKPFKSDALIKVVVQAMVQDMQRHMQAANLKNIELRWHALSDREREVCRLMLAGRGNKDIAEVLQIQPDTVNKHRMKVLQKMQVNTRPELIDLLKGCESLIGV
ncbi:MAG: response regulator transcription factor [Rhodocyclaceae bacterium]|jgi:FixJ family two-component response regulator|nr:response regulator transcription factor [Rhodocyclaceae bacterium]